MNYGLIFAGGRGERMNSRSLPKQFLEMHGKPIIIYTLERFEMHPDIDGVVVVILDGWQGYLRKLLTKFQIEKVLGIVPGGATGQESIYNGLVELAKHASPDSTVLIHDGVRPLITPETISDNIDCVAENGNAITVTRAVETVFLEDEPGTFGTTVDRSRARMARAPQSFVLGDILAAHERARAEGRADFIDSATMMKEYGATLHLVEGPSANIKITTAADFYVFRAMVDALENQQLFGV